MRFVPKKKGFYLEIFKLSFMQDNKSIVFICRRYCPAEAWTNRLLCYAKGFIQNGYNVKLIFLISDKTRNLHNINIEGLQVVNLWVNDGWLARQHRLISYQINKRKIKDYISDYDICFMMDAGGVYVDEILQSHKKVKLVIESTEHPEIIFKGNKSWVYKSFIHAVKKADKICAISKALYDFYVNDIGVSANMVCTTNIFVDNSRFENISRQDVQPYIAYCGSVGTVKDGVDVLIKSFAKFRKIYPEYHLEIYGVGKKEVMEELYHLVEDLNISESVVFTGRISYDEMPQRLINARLLALARPDNLQNRNGFPTKLGEYLATGNPVVVTSVGEIPLFIHDRFNGYLAIPGDVDSFAEKLLEAARDLDEGAIEIGRNGKLLIGKEFSYVENVNRIISSINSNV